MTRRPSAFAVDRRGFIRLAGTTAAGMLSLGATSERIKIVASLTVLSLEDELARRDIENPNTRLGSLILGLRQRGWVEGVNYRFEIRSSFGGPDRLKSAIKELIDLNPDVILTGSTGETAAVMAATRTIPIIFATANDPVGNGFVRSAASAGHGRDSARGGLEEHDPEALGLPAAPSVAAAHREDVGASVERR